MRAAFAIAAGLLALALGACGGSSSKSSSMQPPDPVSSALMAPGIRTVSIPEQRGDITIAVPPCSAASSVTAETTEAPPGSNEIVIPQGALTQTVAVPPCMKQGGSRTSTILLTPGGSEGAQQQAPPGGSQNQLVLPTNSEIETVIVPPCVEGGGGAPQEETPGEAFPTDAKVVVAPPCSLPASASSTSTSGSG